MPLPETFRPCLVQGTLSNETTPDVHEGHWDGKRWKSIRDAGDGHRTLRIDSVTGWAYMPKTIQELHQPDWQWIQTAGLPQVAPRPLAIAPAL